MEGEARIYYTNWRGESSWRRVVPRKLFWGNSPYHDGEGHYLLAFDLDRKAMRTFRMDDVHQWVDEATYQARLKDAREREWQKLFVTSFVHAVREE